MDLARMRNEYSLHGMARSDLADNPFDQFSTWIGQAVDAELIEPNAMTVSTVSADGIPSSRTLLLKGFGSQGFEFFTNYESAKARDLSASPVVALTFPWLGLQRQVNIVGTACRLSDEANDEYFAVRPRDSQLGAWASQQSHHLDSRAELEAAMAQASDRFQDEVPRPDQWGGYVVRPTSVEFWQGRPNRLHDRFRYERASESVVRPGPESPDAWSVQRLSP